MARHTLTIRHWHPRRLNELLGCHWAKAATLKGVDGFVVLVAATNAGLPRATGKRRVRLTLILKPRQRAGDPDAYWKSLLDALTACGLLADDNRQNVELEPLVFARGTDSDWGSLIELEDC